MAAWRGSDYPLPTAYVPLKRPGVVLMFASDWITVSTSTNTCVARPKQIDRTVGKERDIASVFGLDLHDHMQRNASFSIKHDLMLSIALSLRSSCCFRGPKGVLAGVVTGG